MAEVEIVALPADRIQAAGEVLARAFYNDPLVTYLLPDEPTRAPPLAWLMRSSVKFGHLYGCVFTTPNLEAVSVCLTPQSPPGNLWRLLRSGMAFAPLTPGRRRYDRVASAFRPLGSWHCRDAPERHWYLWLLGVEPVLEGRGMGSAMLRCVLGQADAEGMPCLLDTMNQTDVPFYEKRGFEVFSGGEFDRTGPHYWQMRHEPPR